MNLPVGSVQVSTCRVTDKIIGVGQERGGCARDVLVKYSALTETTYIPKKCPSFIRAVQI
jgi:hypothetical protein